ncbi:MAG: hypothetical protein HY348_14140 [Nitrospira defluvii]|nr:hypothetical protein [Nitrospira defluvii]
MKRIAFFVVLLALSTELWAASPWSGVWVLRDPTTKFRLTMTLEEVGAGWKITCRIPVPDAPGAAVTSVMTIETALDGKEVPNLVDGKPSGQTMEIRKIDSHHTFTVVKFQGQQTGISKSELSPDGKTIKTENNIAVSGPNGPAGKQVQYWDKQ